MLAFLKHVFLGKFLAVGGRCHVVSSLEGADEILRVFIADLEGDFRYRQGCGF